MCRFSNVLKSANVSVGDTVVLYLPCSIIAVAAMQACVRLGAPHAVVFAGFSPGKILFNLKRIAFQELLSLFLPSVIVVNKVYFFHYRGYALHIFEVEYF